MESNNWLIVLGALVVGLIVGVLVAPEYISLEELERNALTAEKDREVLAVETELEGCWKSQANAIVVENEKCMSRIKDMAGMNRVLKEDCKRAVDRVERALSDINITVDVNVLDCNC